MDRRTLALSLIIAILVVALGVVGILILRKRAAFPSSNGAMSQPSVRKLPTDTKPYGSIPKAAAWKQGDPVPTSSPPIPSAIPLQPSS